MPEFTYNPATGQGERKRESSDRCHRAALDGDATEVAQIDFTRGASEARC